MTDSPDGEQLLLVPEAVRRAARPRTPKPAPGPAAVDPVAQVLVDVPLAHLDRPFEYTVPEPMAQAAVPGARVRVRFAGQERDGFVLARTAVADHVGRLAPLRRVVSAEPVLSPQLHRLCREVTDRWAGTLPDVLRLAVPPRHAEAEKAPAGDPVPAPERPERGPWTRYPAGPAFLDRLAAGDPVRAAWTALPSAGDPASDWPRAIAVAVLTTLSAGRGALVVVPDARDVARVEAELAALADDGPAVHVALTADLGPKARYAAWLRVNRGEVRAVVGTRAAMFAPVRDLGLVVCWDDGDDLHAEPRAPYPHVRAVLALRSTQEGASLVVGGLARTAEGAALVRSGWARSVAAPREVVRRTAPHVVADPGTDHPAEAGVRGARLPTQAWRAARTGLETGPVLVQVPRSGYLPGLACATCRAPARCDACRGPLATGGTDRPPACRWCGVVATGWACPSCDGRRLRATVVGSGRTAE